MDSIAAAVCCRLTTGVLRRAGRYFTAVGECAAATGGVSRLESGSPGRGEAPGAAWERLTPARFFRDVLSISVDKISFAHPLAWNEIGYGGPSSPRGHVRKWEGGVDPWEAREDKAGY